MLTTPSKLDTNHTLAIFSNNQSIKEMAQNYFNSGWFYSLKLQNQETKKTPQFEYLFANMTNGFSYNKMIFDENGAPTDFIIIEANSAFEEITGLDRKALGNSATKLLSHTENNLQDMIKVFGAVVKTRNLVKQEHFFSNTG